MFSRGDIIKDTYEVLAPLGSGAFGEVFRVKHKYLEELQVLKLLDENYVERSAVETIMAEAKNLVRVSHDNVVRFYDVNSFEKEGRKFFYLTMEQVAGESLSQRWDRQSPFPLSLAVELMKDILAGLGALHAQQPPILHRDINGDNILLGYRADGDEIIAKVADFGLSHIADPVSGTGMAAGRYLFWAQECFHEVYLPASDVFSAGMVFYRMVTGVLPWRYQESSARYGSVEDLETEIVAARKEAPPPPSHWNEKCDEVLDELILRSLDKDLTRRFKDAGEFLEGLNALSAEGYSPRAPQGTISFPVRGDSYSGESLKGEQAGLADLLGWNGVKELLAKEYVPALLDPGRGKEAQALKGLLLYGAAGCGKLYLARKVAEELGCGFMEAGPADLYGEGVRKFTRLEALLRAAAQKAPIVLYIEEIHLLAPRLDLTDAAATCELLCLLNDESLDKVYLVGGSSWPEMVDPALIKAALGHSCRVSLPSSDARQELLRRLLDSRCGPGPFDSAGIAGAMEGYTLVEMVELVEAAMRHAVEEGLDVSDLQLRNALDTMEPSVAVDELQRVSRFESREGEE